jgi:2-dehydropantoate 2-reductase
VIGGLLARAGENVTLIGRRKHVEAINAEGLIIDGSLGTFTVPVHANEELDFRPGLALLAVKAQDVEAACKQIGPSVAGVPIVTLQNGVRSHETAASLLGKDNVLSGAVLFNACYLSPGRATYGVKGGLVIGEAFQKKGKRVEEIGSVLGRAVPTKITDNIQGALWTKLLVNVFGNSLESMTGMGFGECMKYPELREIGIMILREAFKTAEGTGVGLESLPGVPIGLFRSLVRSPLGLASNILMLTMSGAKTLTSTLQSLRRGRPTEIDYLNGEIAAQAEKLRLAAPCNSKVVELVHEIERTGRFFPPSYLAEQFLK